MTDISKVQIHVIIDHVQESNRVAKNITQKIMNTNTRHTVK